MKRDELRKLAEKATPGPWELGTGCSWRRILDIEGNPVIVPTNHHFDGHPDLMCGPNHINGKYAAAANPATILELLDTVDELVGALEYAKDNLPMNRGKAWNYRDQGVQDRIEAALAKVKEDK